MYHSDLGGSFQKLIDATFTKYCGCLLEKTDNGYKALGKEYRTIDEAKQAIDKAAEHLKNSIK